MRIDIDTWTTLSALSLRVFSEDVTVGGRQANMKKNEKFKRDEDMIETPVPEGPAHGEETQGAESTPD
jgi:hypothetical protein